MSKENGLQELHSYISNPIHGVAIDCRGKKTKYYITLFDGKMIQVDRYNRSDDSAELDGQTYVRNGSRWHLVEEAVPAQTR